MRRLWNTTLHLTPGELSNKIIKQMYNCTVKERLDGTRSAQETFGVFGEQEGIVEDLEWPHGGISRLLCGVLLQEQ